MSDGWDAGAFDICFNSMPPDAVGFVKEQYERFGVPVPPGGEFLYSYGLFIMKYVLAELDPYLLYWEFSDVIRNDDWSNYTYEIVGDDGRVLYEADPESLETYSYTGAGTAFFEKFIAMPGLEAMPAWGMQTVKDTSSDFLNGDLWGYFYEFDGKNSIEHTEVVSKLESICTRDGVYNDKMFNAYLDLSLWAAVLWWFGPLSRAFRETISEIHYVTYRYGECIVYDGNVLSPENYRKLPRPVESCYKCGRGTWCVERTLDDNGIPRLICEGCLTEGMERHDGATCGTKFCKYFQCPHNSWYNDAAGQMSGMAKHGQLGQRAQRARELHQLQQPQEVKRIANG